MSARSYHCFLRACVRDTISESDARFLIGYSLLRYICVHLNKIYKCVSDVNNAAAYSEKYLHLEPPYVNTHKKKTTKR